MKWGWIVLIIFILAVVFIRIKRRNYFWKAKDGSELTRKEFLKRYKDGLEGISPLQQTKITLWSFPALIGGILWGIVISIMGKSYWLSLILLGSLPITSMQILSTWQKLQRLKMTEKLMKEAMNNGK